MSSEDVATSLENARQHAELGLPVSRPTRFRFLKRLISRATWPFFHHQVAFNHSIIAAAQSGAGQLADLMSQLADLKEQQSKTAADLHRLINAAVIDLNEKLDLGLRQVFAEIGDHVARARTEHADLALQVAHLTDMSARVDQLAGLRTTVDELQETLSHETSEMHVARAEANVVIDRVRRALPEPITPEALLAGPSAWDDLYLPFEDAFRGPPELIKPRLAIYLDDIKAVDPGGRLVLDIGCGRGDWLELLAEEGIPAYGIDLDERSVERAIANKLDARHGDAFAYLAEIPPGSLAAVTSFHLVEHIGVDNIVALLDLALRALMPGGLLILETPNPENLIVGSTEFYMDPTHRNPIPPALLAFLVGSRGFTNTTIRRLRRSSTEPASDVALAEFDPSIATVLQVMQDRLLASEDYAVLARRG